MTTVLLIILAVAFLGAGGSKLAGAQMHIDNFERWEFPAGARQLVGSIEVAIAALAIAGLFSDTLALIAGILAICTMLGALATHVRAGDPPKEFPPAVALLIVSVVLVATV